MHLKHFGFTLLINHSQKTNERVNNSQRTCDSRYVYQNELNKTCFQQNLAYKNNDLLSGIRNTSVLQLSNSSSNNQIVSNQGAYINLENATERKKTVKFS